MKNLKNKLPGMVVQKLYQFKKQTQKSADTGTAITDPTNNCGTIFTTTHLLQG